MYAGSNPTALQSQRWIAQATLELMDELPWREIAIKLVCSRAGISRQTFYNLFDSKEDVLRYLLRTRYLRELAALDPSGAVAPKAMAAAFAAVVEESEHLLDLMVQNGLEAIITEEVAAAVSLCADQLVRDPASIETLPYAKAMASGALAHLLVCWLKEDQPISVEEMTLLIGQFFAGELFVLPAEPGAGAGPGAATRAATRA